MPSGAFAAGSAAARHRHRPVCDRSVVSERTATIYVTGLHLSGIFIWSAYLSKRSTLTRPPRYASLSIVDLPSPPLPLLLSLSLPLPQKLFAVSG